MQNRVDHTRLKILRLCQTAMDMRTLQVELLHSIQAVVPFDYAYFTTTDPVSGLGTGTVLTEKPPDWCMQAHLDNEFLQADFCKFTDMIRLHQPVRTLSEATGQDLQRSPRYHNLLQPLGMADELRAVFVAGDVCWGTLCLHREQSQELYTASEADFVARLVPSIGDSLRRASVLQQATSGMAPDGPGVLILEDDLSVVALTAAAEHWLAEMLEDEPADRTGLPTGVRQVIGALKAVDRGLGGAEFSPQSRLKTRSGRWLQIHASWLRGTGDQRRISVVFEPAQPSAVMSLIMLAYSLTKRESDVTQCVLRGMSTREISEQLHISQNTVQDHLKSVFDKVDVNSRGELAARLFVLQHA